jgi:hypothetical protein
VSTFDESESAPLLKGLAAMFLEDAQRNVGRVDHTITVWAEVSSAAAGVLVCCQCEHRAGWSLFVQDRRLRFRYDWGEIAYYEVCSDVPIPTGTPTELMLVLSTDEHRTAAPVRVRLSIDGTVVGVGWIACQPCFRVATLDVGVDYLSPVRRWYPRGQPGFPFSGRIGRVTSEFAGVVRDITPIREAEPLATVLEHRR